MDFDHYHQDLADRFVAATNTAGGLPAYLAIRTTDIGPGTMTAQLEVRPELLNPFGSLHGGVLAALADHVLGAVLYPVIPKGSWAATTQLNLNFTAPVPGGTLTAKSEIISLTKRTAVVRIDIHNDGRLAGAAQGTVTITTPPASTRRAQDAQKENP